MSLCWPRGLLVENVILLFGKDRYHLRIEKRFADGPVQIIAEEMRSKNILRSKQPKIYTLETNEEEVVTLLDPENSKVPNLDDYMNAIMKHLKFNYVEDRLRLMDRASLEELNDKKRMALEEKNQPPKPRKSFEEITPKVLDRLLFDRSTQRLAEGGRSKYVIRRNFLRQLSSIRSYIMELQQDGSSGLGTVSSEMHNAPFSPGSSRIAKTCRIKMSSSKSQEREQFISAPDDVTASEANETFEKYSETSETCDGQRILQIGDCGKLARTAKIWGPPGTRVARSKNRFLHEHGGKAVFKMTPAKKASGGFRPDRYVSNLSYSHHMTLGKSNLISASSSHSKDKRAFGKLYRHWSTGKLEK
jgi:hypothetical protein